MVSEPFGFIPEGYSLLVIDNIDLGSFRRESFTSLRPEIVFVSYLGICSRRLCVFAV